MAVCCLGAALLLSAQTADLVRLNVVVRGPKGEPLDDLKKEDFTVSDRGKRPQIAKFSVESAAASDDDKADKTPPLPPNTFTNRIELLPRPAESVTVVLFDELNTKFEDQPEARRRLVHYLGELLPQDRVALYVLGADLRVLYDYTTDASRLLRTLAGYQGRINSDNSGRKGDGGELDRWIREGDQKPASGAAAITRTTLAALHAIADHVARVPGRKNLVWISGAFSGDASAGLKALQRRGLAVYPVMAGSGSQETARALASRTGGRAFASTNELKNALRAAIDDARVSYAISFAPDNRDGSFHLVTVEVNRRGAVVTQPLGYYPFPARPATEAETKAEFQQALWSPIESGALGLTLRLAPKQNMLRVVMLLDLKNIQLKHEGDRWTGKVETLFSQQALEDRPATLVGDSIEIDLTPAAYQEASRQGLLWSKDLVLADARYQLKVVARDVGSGNVGAVIVPMKGLR